MDEYSPRPDFLASKDSPLIIEGVWER